MWVLFILTMFLAALFGIFLRSGDDVSSIMAAGGTIASGAMFIVLLLSTNSDPANIEQECQEYCNSVHMELIEIQFTSNNGHICGCAITEME